MFEKLFKSKTEVKTEIVESKKKTYPKEVLEIHHEFEIASDKLVESALQIINTAPKVNESKLDRLKKFGFNQSREVEEAKPILESTTLSKEQIELAKYYQQHYPFNKFITEPQVKEICHKYNLVCGDVSRFKGFVPEEKLIEIESFVLKENDFTQLFCFGFVFYTKEECVSLGYWDRNREEYESYENGTKKSSRFKQERQEFKICAPVKDMDLTGLELVEGYKLQRKIEIPDPVVLQPVRGGYLIVASWGDEASDPLVVNANHN